MSILSLFLELPKTAAQPTYVHLVEKASSPIPCGILLGSPQCISHELFRRVSSSLRSRRKSETPSQSQTASGRTTSKLSEVPTIRQDHNANSCVGVLV